MTKLTIYTSDLCTAQVRGSDVNDRVGRMVSPDCWQYCKATRVFVSTFQVWLVRLCIILLYGRVTARLVPDHSKGKGSQAVFHYLHAGSHYRRIQGVSQDENHDWARLLHGGKPVMAGCCAKGIRNNQLSPKTKIGETTSELEKHLICKVRLLEKYASRIRRNRYMLAIPSVQLPTLS